MLIKKLLKTNTSTKNTRTIKNNFSKAEVMYTDKVIAITDKKGLVRVQIGVF
ncbi:hypothetical protein [Providencia phage PSTCR7]|uniref:Uncharacterized protein n=1 Tax=Providencia phage PSTCR7 TaxID=2783549 RepID=A0A7S9XHW3_9CAUD|nr:hypothetical protein PQD10_gp02 [Providencia phage PSTCR7]QPI18454.1 hypothetical protein [Providencia phage PSTCR7]